MNDLLKINHDDGVNTVSGRELWEALEIGTRYNDWFSRMLEYGFIENEDYYSILSNRVDGKAGKQRADHQLTLDMAKEICMIQRTEIGKACRKYFIEVEKAYQEEMKAKYLLEVKQAHHSAYLEVNKDEFKKMTKDYKNLKDYCKSLEKRINILEKYHPIGRFTKTLDSAERFIHEFIIIPLTHDITIEKSMLYKYYVEYCYLNGFLPYSSNLFTRKLQKCFANIQNLTISQNGETYYKLAITKKS